MPRMRFDSSDDVGALGGAHAAPASHIAADDGFKSGAPAIAFNAADASNWATEPHEVNAALNALANGEALPYLLCDGSRKLTGNWLTSSTTHELQFYSSVNSIHGNLTALILDGGGTINLYTGGSPRATVSSGGLDVIGWCRAGAVRVDSAHGGIAGTITFTNATLAPSGAPSFIQAALPAAGGPGNLIADMWVEIKIGTVAYWFLAWTA